MSGRDTKAPLVSVIVTVRNGERYIEGCLASICSSTYGDLEIVIVNDGSVDGTGAVVRDSGRQDTRIRVLEIGANGRRAALELAHRSATGSLQCWVDADDLVHPEAIGACVAKIDADHQLVFTHRDLIDQDGTVVGPHAKNEVQYRPSQLLVDNMIFHLRMFTTDLFERSGGVGELESAIDWDMNLRMAELTTPRCVPRRLYSYRVHAQRMSGRPEQQEAGRVAVERAIKRRGLDAELVVDDLGWHLRKRGQNLPNRDRLRLPPNP